MAKPAEIPFLTSDAYYSVPVDEHTDTTKVAAARWLLVHLDGDPDESPEAVATLVAEASPATLSKHVKKQPEEVGCFCEDEGWWCQDGDGPLADFWQFDRTIADNASEEAVSS